MAKWDAQVDEYERGRCSICYETIYRLPRWEFRRTSPPILFTTEQDTSQPIPVQYERTQVYDFYLTPEGRRVTFCPGCGAQIRC